jgi:hypothetical protein
VGGKLTEFITQINNCYPPEVVEYYSPSYSKTLLDKIDEYVVRTNTEALYARQHTLSGITTQ